MPARPRAGSASLLSQPHHQQINTTARVCSRWGFAVAGGAIDSKYFRASQPSNDLLLTRFPNRTLQYLALVSIVMIYNVHGAGEWHPAAAKLDDMSFGRQPELASCASLFPVFLLVLSRNWSVCLPAPSLPSQPGHPAASCPSFLPLPASCVSHPTPVHIPLSASSYRCPTGASKRLRSLFVSTIDSPVQLYPVSDATIKIQPVIRPPAAALSPPPPNQRTTGVVKRLWEEGQRVERQPKEAAGSTPPSRSKI